MTSTTTIPEVKPASNPNRVDLVDRLAEIQCDIGRLDAAIDDLVRSLLWLEDDESFPASVCELASSMLRDAEEVRYQFDCGDFSGQVEELERLAEQESEADKEAAS